MSDDYNIAQLPLSCAHRATCHGAFSSLKHKDDMLVDLRTKMEQANERARELDSQLLIRTQSAELSRAKATIKALQAADVAQRKTIDNLSGEAYELRRIMRESKTFDMAEIQDKVSGELHKYRLAVEEDR